LGQACFVVAGWDQPSSHWMTHAAKRLGWPICTVAQAGGGEEPEAEVYVVQMTQVPPPTRRWQTRGKGVFLWLDDALWLMPDFTKPAKMWQGLWPEVLHWLAEVDGVIAPSQVLADDLSRWNRNVNFIPNYHAYDEALIPQVARTKLIGYAGSLYHWLSWRDTRAWETLPKGAGMVIVDLAMLASAIELARPDLRVTRTGRLDTYDYLGQLASWRYEPIPMHGAYDLRRSWIKALECCLVGTPWQPIGNACEAVYAGVPNYEQPDTNLAKVWARQQHIQYHLDEWKGVLGV
jgi:hypothetical protein